MSDIDRSVARVLRLKFLLGLFEDPFVDPDRAESVARCAEHRRLALQAAREGMILLKNEGSTLPLANDLKSITVIGPNADNTWNQFVVYYYHRYAGYRKHLDLDAAGPLYPFGFGLSYTTFKHANLKIQPQSIRNGESAQVTVDVTNTAKMAGDEVVQLYIRDKVASVARPPLQLKGFQRVHLQPGETKTVVVDIGQDELCFYGLDRKWTVEPGDFAIMIGRSSRDIALVGKLTVNEE